MLDIDFLGIIIFIIIIFVIFYFVSLSSAASLLFSCLCFSRSLRQNARTDFSRKWTNTYSEIDFSLKLFFVCFCVGCCVIF
jgi:hypothetical protein